MVLGPGPGQGQTGAQAGPWGPGQAGPTAEAGPSRGQPVASARGALGFVRSGSQERERRVLVVYTFTMGVWTERRTMPDQAGPGPRQ